MISGFQTHPTRTLIFLYLRGGCIEILILKANHGYMCITINRIELIFQLYINSSFESSPHKFPHTISRIPLSNNYYLGD